MTVSIGDSPEGEWTEVLSETLSDYRQDKEPLPLVSFTLEEMVNSQFVKLECTEWYGHSCALRYFNVIKSGILNHKCDFVLESIFKINFSAKELS